MIIKNIPIDRLENNTGQILGINQNPRDLTNDGFDLVVKSIQDFPEMLEARELVVIPIRFRHSRWEMIVTSVLIASAEKYVVIGGNQRLRALKELGYTEAPCKIVEWSIEQINEFIIKDNLSYGSWDWNLIANEWDVPQLIDWGLELPISFDDVEPEDVKVIDKNTMFGLTIETENKMNFDMIKKELDRLKIGYVEFEK